MNNRQAGRRRGRGGQRPGGNPGRADNGNRIDNRARGNAAQLLEKYKNLARDAQMSGDRVTTEYYLQFADHYFRVLSESRSRFEDGNTRRPSNDISDDEDDDYGFEGEVASPAAYVAQASIQQDDEREPRQDTGQRRDRSEQGERPRRGDDGSERAERPRHADRDDSERAPRPRRADREDGGERAERPRRVEREDAGERIARPRRAERPGGEQQAEQPRDEAPREAHNGFARDVEPRDEPPVPANDEAREQPRRRGRPRREAVAEVATEGFDAALLPPSLNVEAAPAAASAEPAERPRRRRRAQSEDEVVPPAA